MEAIQDNQEKGNENAVKKEKSKTHSTRPICPICYNPITATIVKIIYGVLNRKLLLFLVFMFFVIIVLHIGLSEKLYVLFVKNRMICILFLIECLAYSLQY